MYSVLYPELNLGGVSGMVPETLRISSEDILGQCDEHPVPSICKCQNLYYIVCGAQCLFRDYFKALERICRRSAYQFHSTFLRFSESVRMRSQDGCLTQSISVVVIKIWLWAMT